MSMWLAYLFGACAALAYKLTKARFNGVYTREYFFADSQSSLTTVTMFGVIWMMGAAYISFGGEFGLPELPRHQSIAFVLGSLGEVIAPIVIKKLLGMVEKEG